MDTPFTPATDATPTDVLEDVVEDVVGATPVETSGFSALALKAAIIDALGYATPTPIQREAIPHILSGRDVIGQAATGTGKTAAFALPILERLGTDRGVAPSALVLVPTRELAIQVSSAFATYGRPVNARVLAVYGGEPIRGQLRALARGVDIVVATPGRAVDHLRRNSLDLSAATTVVLDEADEMLDMGFAEELNTILENTPTDRQTVLFSATFPKRIANLVRHHLNDPVKVAITAASDDAASTSTISQVAYVATSHEKSAVLARVLELDPPGAAIVFCRTRNDVDTLTAAMNGLGYRTEALHGGMDQDQRDRVMQRIRAKTTNLLIATDVAARGLDIDHLTHVVNFDVPTSPDAYVHRIGRVGRAGRDGVAITLVEPRQKGLLKAIERQIRSTLEVRPVPSVADIKARRLTDTSDALKALLDADGIPAAELEQLAAVVAELTATYHADAVAIAALALAHRERSGAALDDVDLPARTLGQDTGSSPRGGKFAKRGPNAKGGKGERRASAAGTTRLFIGLGARQGIRAKDLVGAIANESRVSGNDIGNIDITPNFSLVDVPSDAIGDVIHALKNTTIKGKRAPVRLDRNTSEKG